MQDMIVIVNPAPEVWTWGCRIRKSHCYFDVKRRAGHKYFGIKRRARALLLWLLREEPGHNYFAC